MGNTLKSKWLDLGLVVFLGMAAPSLQAANKYWDTTATTGLQSGNGTWDTATTSLWNDVVGGTNPLTTWANGDDAFFSATGTSIVTLNGTIQANTFTSTAGTITLNGGTLQLNSAATALTGTPTLTINSNVILGANQTWSGTDRVNGDITGAFTLSTANNSRLFLNGTNSIAGFSITNSSGSAVLITLGGNTTLSGALSLSTAGAKLTSGANNSFNTVTIGTSGSYASLGGTNAFSGALTINSGGLLIVEKDANMGNANLSFGNGGLLRILGTQLTTFGSRTVTIASGSGDDTTIDIADAANTFTLNKNVVSSSNANFVKAGQGTIILTQANTSTGTYLVRGGLLNLDASTGSVAATSKLALGGGTFQLSGASGGTTNQTMGAVTLNIYGGTIKVDGGTSTATTLNLGAITATAAGSSLNFEKTGTTTPTITTSTTVDPTGIYSGRITYQGSDWATTTSGQVAAYASYATLATAAGSDTLNSQVTLGGATTLAAGAHTTNTLKINNASTGTLDIGGGTLTLTGGGLLFTGATNYAINNGTLNSGTATASDLVVHQYGTGTLTINSVIADGIGASTLTKTGSGTLVLGTNNTYTGQTYINGGTLSGADFSGTASIFGGATATTQVNINNGTLQYTGVTDTTTRTMSIGSSGATLDVAGGSGVILTWNAVISNTAATNPGSLTKTGTGTLALSGANTFSGGIFINQGVLQLGSTTALGTSTVPNAVNFGAGSTGTLRLNGQSVTAAGLKSNATVGTPVVENASNTAATLTINSAFADTYAGVIQNGTGTGALSLVKENGNTLTLSGSNTYTGTTAVNAGTLLVNGSLGTTAVTVARGATLGGSGSIGGLVTFQSGSISSPGNSPGKPIYSAGATYETGSTFKFELIADKDNDNGIRGTDFDGVDVTGGTLTIQSGVTFNIVMNVGSVNYNSSFWDSNQSWLVFDNANAPSVVAGIFTLGTISTDASLNPFSTTGGAFSFSQTGNDIYLNYTAVPEPSTYAMLLGGLGLLAYLRRRYAKAGA